MRPRSIDTRPDPGLHVVPPPAEPTLTASGLLTRYLEAEGVRHVFSIPGGPLMPVLESLSQSGRIRVILAKHEEGAAFMADGYARVRRGLGVCALTAGPGATNAMTGVAVSYTDGVPVMVLTAQVATSAFGRGALQDGSSHGIDVVDLFKPVTKSSLMLLRADKMGEVVRRLLRVSLNGRPGPVHLNVPADLAGKPVPDAEDVPAQIPRSANSYFDRDAVKRASDLLLRARRPALLVGGGVVSSGAYEEVRRLAERLAVPVATTAKAKGAFPEDHALSLGVFGFAGSPRAEAYLLSGEVDVLLAVATSLGEDATNGWDPRLAPREALLHIDIDPMQIGNNYRAEVPLVGDARTVLREILFQVERGSRWFGAPARSPGSLEALRRAHPAVAEPEKAASEAMPLKPQRLMADLSEALPPDAIVFSDIGHHLAFALHYLRAPRPHSFFHALGFAPMGYGAAACIGGKLAAPERPVVAIVGDACFAMNGMEVHTACEADVPVVWIVVNNGGNGMVHHGERAQFDGRLRHSLYRRPLDAARLGAALGAESRLVTRPGEIGGALRQALASGRPTVIDVAVDLEETPPIGARLDSLNRYFAGV